MSDWIKFVDMSSSTGYPECAFFDQSTTTFVLNNNKRHVCQNMSQVGNIPNLDVAKVCMELVPEGFFGRVPTLNLNEVIRCGFVKTCAYETYEVFVITNDRYKLTINYFKATNRFKCTVDDRDDSESYVELPDLEKIFDVLILLTLFGFKLPKVYSLGYTEKT